MHLGYLIGLLLVTTSLTVLADVEYAASVQSWS